MAEQRMLCFPMMHAFVGNRAFSPLHEPNTVQGALQFTTTSRPPCSPGRCRPPPAIQHSCRCRRCRLRCPLEGSLQFCTCPGTVLGCWAVSGLAFFALLLVCELDVL